MNLHEFKNEKIVAILGALTPLFVLSLIAYICVINIVDAREHPGTVLLATLLVTLTLVLIYYFMLMSPSSNITIDIHKSVIVYTKWGKYFMIKHKKDNYYHLLLYENKYWIFLSRVPVDAFSFNGDVDRLNSDINKSLRLINRTTEKEQELERSFKEWDKITDDIAKRDKLIDKIL